MRKETEKGGKKKKWQANDVGKRKKFFFFFFLTWTEDVRSLVDGNEIVKSYCSYVALP